MSYIALYRKLRPKTFLDVVGQDHIIRTLQNQITRGKISHAYLFSGTRGTGKTSTAKIFAKAINCYNLEDGQPCNKCKSCLSVIENRSINIIEIDAASNNGVDNIREIREEVRYVPTEGKYKVYIIDEVHMLSIGAFNALLKTLEEPPEHVVFILATTDPQKVPPTIHSRCQRFEFKRIPSKDMVNTIKTYMSKENVNIEEEAIVYIVKISEGAMRDALSILDKCISFYYDEDITLKKVLFILGSVDDNIYFMLVEAFINYDSLKSIKIIEEIIFEGKDINQFVFGFISYLRNLLISQTIEDDKILDLPKDSIIKLKEQSSKIEQEIIINYINLFSSLQTQIKNNLNSRILLEILCIKICNPSVSDDKELLYQRLVKLENSFEDKKNFIYEAKDIKINKEDKKNFKPIVKEKAVPKDIENVISSFKEFIKIFDGILKEILSLSTPGYLEEEILYIVVDDLSSLNFLKNKEEIIKLKLYEKFSKDFFVKIILKDEYNKKHKEMFGNYDENISEFNETDIKSKLNVDIFFD